MGDPLDRLRRAPGIGESVKRAFTMLWALAGGHPGQVVVTCRQLATPCGKHPRTAGDWLETLQAIDLIRIVFRDRLRGSYTIDVFHPRKTRKSGGTPAAASPIPTYRIARRR